MTARLLRFLIAGGIAAAVEYLAFLALQFSPVATGLLLNQSISFACGFVVSFLLSRHWVFRSKEAWGPELTKYGTLATINLAIGGAAIGVLVETVNVPAPLAKALVMAMIAVCNYTMFSKLVFRQRSTS